MPPRRVQTDNIGSGGGVGTPGADGAAGRQGRAIPAMPQDGADGMWIPPRRARDGAAGTNGTPGTNGNDGAAGKNGRTIPGMNASESGSSDIWVPARKDYPPTTVTRTLWVSSDIFNSNLDAGVAGTNGTAPDIISMVILADAATQGFYFNTVTPNDWASGVVQYTMYWSPTATDAVAHTVRWSTDVLKFITGTTVTNAAGTTTAFTGTSAARTQAILYTEAAQTLYTPTTAGELVRVDIRRLGADAADTYVGNVRVHGVLITYTANR